MSQDERTPAPTSTPNAGPPGRRTTLLSGHSAVVPISDLLAWLSGLRKSGVLRVQTPIESFTVQLQDGAVVFAQGDLPRTDQRLGQVLIDERALSETRLHPALEAASAERLVIGRYLVREGLVSPAHLAGALARQAQAIFHRMFAAQDATWRFEHGGRVVETQDMRLNVIQLLLESARADDEHRLTFEAQVGVPLAMAAPD